MTGIISKLAPRRVVSLTFHHPAFDAGFEDVLAPYLNTAPFQRLSEKYESIGADQLRSLAAKIKNFGPDLIVVNGFYSQLPTVLKTLAESGATAPILGGLNMSVAYSEGSLRFYQSAPIYFAMPQYIYHQLMKVAPSQAQASFEQEFRRAYQTDPTYESAYAFDAVTFFARAAAGGTDSFDATALTLKGFVGATGELRLDGKGSAQTAWVPAVARNGVVEAFR
jgi:ABC-type branched-subunit amino acid transport system substrate-binding protein